MISSLQDEFTAIASLVEYVHESYGIDAGSVPGNQLKHQAFMCPPNWAPFIESLPVSTPLFGLIHQDEEFLATLEEFVASKGRVTSGQLFVFRGFLIKVIK